MKHLLLQTAFLYKKRGPLEFIKGFNYNRTLGAWLSNIDDKLLIHHSEYPAVASKKFDVETGEDHKGQ